MLVGLHHRAAHLVGIDVQPLVGHLVALSVDHRAFDQGAAGKPDFELQLFLLHLDRPDQLDEPGLHHVQLQLPALHRGDPQHPLSSVKPLNFRTARRLPGAARKARPVFRGWGSVPRAGPASVGSRQRLPLVVEQGDHDFSTRGELHLQARHAGDDFPREPRQITFRPHVEHHFFTRSDAAKAERAILAGDAARLFLVPLEVWPRRSASAFGETKIAAPAIPRPSRSLTIPDRAASGSSCCGGFRPETRPAREPSRPPFRPGPAPGNAPSRPAPDCPGMSGKGNSPGTGPTCQRPAASLRPLASTRSGHGDQRTSPRRRGSVLRRPPPPGPSEGLATEKGAQLAIAPNRLLGLPRVAGAFHR